MTTVFCIELLGARCTNLGDTVLDVGVETTAFPEVALDDTWKCISSILLREGRPRERERDVPSGLQQQWDIPGATTGTTQWSTLIGTHW